jgi:RNAse (barnase) inhibitor barstar
MTKQTITIDGNCFTTLDEFFTHFQDVALEGRWGSNLDAFNDVLRGGYGTPDGGFILVWRNHLLSKTRLGYIETQRVLRAKLRTCHPSNVDYVQRELASAEANKGDTVFDWLIEIITDHGPGGSEQEDGVELVLQ